MNFFLRGFWGPFFVFCVLRASEALYSKTFLLEVVSTFDKDHFLFYDFFLLRPIFVFCFFRASGALLGKKLFTPGGNVFRQGSFVVLWIFFSEASEALFLFEVFSWHRLQERPNLELVSRLVWKDVWSLPTLNFFWTPLPSNKLGGGVKSWNSGHLGWKDFWHRLHWKKIIS